MNNIEDKCDDIYKHFSIVDKNSSNELDVYKNCTIDYDNMDIKIFSSNCIINAKNIIGYNIDVGYNVDVVCGDNCRVMCWYDKCNITCGDRCVISVNSSYNSFKIGNHCSIRVRAIGNDIINSFGNNCKVFEGSGEYMLTDKFVNYLKLLRL